MGGSSHTTETRLSGLQIQTSLLGQPIPIGWGRTRLSCNLIEYVAFKAIPQTTKQGGKGGSSTNTTYTYTASIILALCEGTIIGVRTVYKDSSIFKLNSPKTGTALAQAGLSLATGTLTQAPWGYMTSNFPARALGYSQTAYVYAQDYALGSGATLSNHGFEVDFAIQFGPNGDALPTDVVTDFLTNAAYGVTGWGAGLLGNWADIALYTKANNLLLSPVLDQSTTGADFLKRIAQQTNTEFFWSEGVLKWKTYGDAAVTGNSVTWTPNLTPVFALNEDDFLDEVHLEIVDQTDAYNYVQVEYFDRTNQYQPSVAVAQDLDNIITYGLRKRDPEQFHDICDATIAQQVVQLRLQQCLYLRDIYTFTLPEDFIAIEPMDYLSLTTQVDGMVLTNQLVIVQSIDEDATGNLTIMAKGLPGQHGSTPTYTSHISQGFQPSVDADPGNVAVPYLFNAPSSLITTTGLEVWCAVAGVSTNWGGANVWISVDGTSYSQVGTLAGPARYGTLSASLASHADPDSANTMAVDLTISGGALASVTTAEADAGASLCYVAGELISYGTATLTSAAHYGLTYLRRGQRGSVPAAHASGTTFVRLDGGVFKFAYPTANAGSTIYVKFQSFNIYGRAMQDISTLTAYTVSPASLSSFPDAATGLALVGGGSTWTGATLSVSCDASARATGYQFNFYKSDGVTMVRSIVSPTPFASYTSSMALADGALREYKISVAASNAAGSSATSAQLDVTNAAPAAVTSPAIAGGTVTAVASCTASTDPDLAGYIVFYSATSGFSPATAGAIVQSGGTTINIYGLAAGTYYGLVAAYDPWSTNPAGLNLSSQISFTISTGGGSSPTGSPYGYGYNDYYAFFI
jgi:hypothetical protein